MSSANAAAALTAEELRRKRLAALDPSSNVARKRQAVIDLCSDEEDQKKRACTTPPNGFNFLDSDSDEDEAILQAVRRTNKEEPKKIAAKRSPLRTMSTAAARSSTANTGSWDKDRTDEEDRQRRMQINERKPQTTKKNAKGGQTQESSSTLSPSSTSYDFSIASYNLWFGPQGDGAPHGTQRMKAVSKLLLDCSPTFIGFQEVIQPLASILFPRLEQAGYRLFRQTGVGYGVALAVLDKGPKAPAILDAGWQGYKDTIMARGFLYVRARLPHSDRQCLFTTTHLESYVPGNMQQKTYTGAKERAKQILQLEAFCLDQMRQISNLQTSIIAGDLNYDDERKNPQDEPMHSVLRQDWKDAWVETQPSKSKGYTYDGKTNPMLSNSLRRRFDRCLVKSKDESTVVSTQLIGTQALEGLTWQKYNPWKQTSKETLTAPSDHFGLVATLRSKA